MVACVAVGSAQGRWAATKCTLAKDTTSPVLSVVLVQRKVQPDQVTRSSTADPGR
jgi:hypothetical protein